MQPHSLRCCCCWLTLLQLLELRRGAVADGRSFRIAGDNDQGLAPAAAAAQTADVSQQARLLWASQPVRPNATLMVQGFFPAGRATRAVLKALCPGGPEASVVAMNEWDSDTALYFLVPASFPDQTGLRLSVLAADETVADSITVNAPRIKWLQGDAGSKATAGGTIRLFGSALAFGPPAEPRGSAAAAAGTYGDYQLLESELTHAIHSHDHAVVAEAAARLARLGAALSGVGCPSTLILRAVSRPEAAAINVSATNATDVDAFFDLPSTIPPGEQRPCVSIFVWNTTMARHDRLGTNAKGKNSTKRGVAFRRRVHRCRQKPGSNGRPSGWLRRQGQATCHHSPDRSG